MEENTISQRCRACLASGNEMHHVKERYASPDESVRSLLELLKICASIQVIISF